MAKKRRRKAKRDARSYRADLHRRREAQRQKIMATRSSVLDPRRAKIARTIIKRRLYSPKRLMHYPEEWIKYRTAMRPLAERAMARRKAVWEIRSYLNPLKPVICARRAIRRNVLFALKRAGKGKGGPKDRKYNLTSKISC